MVAYVQPPAQNKGCPNKLLEDKEGEKIVKIAYILAKQLSLQFDDFFYKKKLKKNRESLFTAKQSSYVSLQFADFFTIRNSN